MIAVHGRWLTSFYHGCWRPPIVAKDWLSKRRSGGPPRRPSRYTSLPRYSHIERCSTSYHSSSIDSMSADSRTSGSAPGYAKRCWISQWCCRLLVARLPKPRGASLKAASPQCCDDDNWQWFGVSNTEPQTNAAEVSFRDVIEVHWLQSEHPW